MSTYQYYEFLAVDRPLDARQQSEVRTLSTRARITATTFTNEYHWGDFRGDPNRMMERYYDAHLYLADWGTHRVMLRLPRTLLDLDVAEQYCVGNQVTAWVSNEHLILDLSSEDESGEWDEGAEDSLSAIVAVRAELGAGDLRPLYLAWLSAFGAWERDEDAFGYADEDELEPPVPAGLGSLSAGQQALADFLRIDADLLAVAAEASPAQAVVRDDPRELATWIANLTEPEKSDLLLRVVRDQAAAVRMELLRRFHGEPKNDHGDLPRRSVAELLDAAAERRQERGRRIAAGRAEEEARRERERALAREKRLEALAQDEDGAWLRVNTMIGTRKPGEYDAAVELLGDLRAVAERADRLDGFTRRFMLLRQEHLRKPSLIERFDRAGLTDPPMS
ncbi:hypothetical protein SAMN05216276_1001330 [Streptosporangium subroseum]|uniref:Uncharacterized protein n=1 Tax=Streptosporangium subroseum TaxID=106412 RepID=A0A239ADX7_9ACTN|nr:hypothetical protein [Streptosporangium subroseum]SNR93779.1 hypothetical protein SAMN05216276_1001330 [Streptosporangium subroseum]